MASYKIENGVITCDFEEEGVDPVVLDTNALAESVKAQAMFHGLQTAMRAATAGKMDEPAKARESMINRVATWLAGQWASEATTKAAVELTQDERSQVTAAVLVMARRAKGDTRSDADILAAFGGLDKDRKAAILAQLQKAIDKKLKEALRTKKTLAKVGAGAEY